MRVSSLRVSQYAATRVEVNPVPASKKDIAELASLLRWTKSSHRISHIEKEQILVEALEKAISYLAEPDRRKNIMAFVLSALRQSVRKSEQSTVTWQVVDVDLYNWAMDQIESLLGPTEH